MSITLSPDELQELTGYKTGSKQCRWIRDQLGIEPAKGIDGRPRITREVVNHAMLARKPGATDTGRPMAQPNWTR